MFQILWASTSNFQSIYLNNREFAINPVVFHRIHTTNHFTLSQFIFCENNDVL